MLRFKRVVLSIALLCVNCVLISSQHNSSERIQQITNWVNINQKQIYDIWQRPLGQYVVYADRQSRAVFSTWQIDSSYIRVSNGLFEGVLADSVIIANTDIVLNEMPAALVALPVPDDFERALLLVLHESFHSIQDSIFKTRGCNNSHLNEPEACALLKTECHYLANALASTNNQRDSLLCQALACRFHRMNLYSDYTDDEAAFELTEGLAEYTAIKAVYISKSNSMAYIREKSDALLDAKSIHRRFGYVTGLIYALLLDSYVPGWKLCLNSDSNMAIMLKESICADNRLTIDVCSDSVFTHYYNQELLRQQQIQHFNDSVKTVFANTPSYIVPLSSNRQFGFSPNHMFNIPDFGIFFPFMELTDQWGKIVVKPGGGVLLIEGNKKAKVLMKDNYIEMKIDGDWKWQKILAGMQLVKAR
ncbi:hypothetical protein KEM09_17390 [Carboxylicivirga mesophila]|uniref:Uncharacterized protein n=1 Tax=Carboxylicivirga mesophila TaxID=1166478 RepID=A0ABS5KDY7_9BACT|nr:hypothetical protein [Carboxylicivirga mesophila]MBS2213191.1 hypothetical protein [Carboxylicivirga mesophila]